MSKGQTDIVNSYISSTDHWVYGFTQIDNGIIDHPNLDIYDKMVYITIKRMINQQDKITFPSYEKIGEGAGCSRRKAIDTVQNLIKLDLIENLGRHSVYGSNVYMLKRIQESKVLAEPEKNMESVVAKIGEVVPMKPKEDKKTDPIPYKDIIDYLSEKAGKRFVHTAEKHRKDIRARYNELKKAGMDHETIIGEFKRVVDVMVHNWKGTTFTNGQPGDKYLQPSTLFGGKFDSYRNESPVNKQASGQGGQADWKKRFLEEGE